MVGWQPLLSCCASVKITMHKLDTKFYLDLATPKGKMHAFHHHDPQNAVAMLFGFKCCTYHLVLQL
jgi:alpha-D-ribose 1-methylphosphonate 5-triphosphate synthase subunit PhnH